MDFDTAPTLRVLIGAPASGKTTWCDQHAHEFGANQLGTVLSAGKYREHLTGDPADQYLSDQVFDQIASDINLVLGRFAQDVVVDTTGTNPRDRVRWLDLARRHNAHTIAVVFRTPLRICFKRNRKHGRKVSPHIVRSMSRRIQTLTTSELKEEGFHAVQG